MLSDSINESSKQLTEDGKLRHLVSLENLDKNILKIINVKNSMNAKKSYGGTASNNVTMMIKKYKKEIK